MRIYETTKKLPPKRSIQNSDDFGAVSLIGVGSDEYHLVFYPIGDKRYNNTPCGQPDILCGAHK